jgi:predicted MFS family arabinose efflux permease
MVILFGLIVIWLMTGFVNIVSMVTWKANKKAAGNWRSSNQEDYEIGSVAGAILGPIFTAGLICVTVFNALERAATSFVANRNRDEDLPEE